MEVYIKINKQIKTLRCDFMWRGKKCDFAMEDVYICKDVYLKYKNIFTVYRYLYTNICITEIFDAFKLFSVSDESFLKTVVHYLGYYGKTIFKCSN